MRLQNGDRKVVALMLQRQDGQEWHGAGLTLERTRKKVVLADVWEGAGPIGPLVRGRLPQDVPVVLVVGGRDVLHKSIPFDSGGSRSVAERAGDVVPGLKPGDFHLQVAEGDTHDFLSLIRQDALDELLAQDWARKPWIVAVSLGPFSGAFLWATVFPQTKTAHVAVRDMLLVLKDGRPARLSTVRPAPEEEITIGGDKIGAGHAPAYGAALQWLLQGGLTPQAMAEPVQERLAEWRMKRRFERTGTALLAVLFTGLLANFLFYQHFSARTTELRARAGVFDMNSHRQAESYRQSVQKREFLRQEGWLSPTRHSLHADLLAANLPLDIHLLELSLNPLDTRRSRNEKRSVFSSNTVRIRGICHDPEPLREWMQRLEKESWIEWIGEPDYHYDSGRQDGTFTLLIHLHANTR